MKRALIFSFSLCLLACQSAPLRSISPSELVRQQAVKTPIEQDLNAAKKPLKLNPSLKNDLRNAPHEPAPVTETYDQNQLKQIFKDHLEPGTQYVHAHSLYFAHLDNGKSTIETILAHDGHAQAAKWVAQWRQVLAEGSLWPDHNSTTYNGPFKALEHGLPGINTGWFGLRNAREKSQEYYELALKAWKPGLPPDHPEQAEAWAWLGRTSHFIQDMSVPFHTRSLVRPAQVLYHNAYEVSSEKLFENYLPGRNHNPFGVWANGPYPENEPWGIYFPKGVQAGDLIVMTAEKSQPFYDLVAQRDNAEQSNWEKSRAVMIPLGAKSTAGLVVSFLRELGVTP